MLQVSVCDQERAKEQRFAKDEQAQESIPICSSETYLNLLLQQLIINQLESVASFCHDFYCSSQALQLSRAAALTCGNTI